MRSALQVAVLGAIGALLVGALPAQASEATMLAGRAGFLVGHAHRCGVEEERLERATAYGNELIAAFAKEAGVHAYASAHQGLPMHYGTLNPMHYLNPRRDKRVLPVSILYTSSVHNDLHFGELIGRAIKTSDRRVVSHE